ncbi:hypothetical protein BD309DRAFT_973314 [Dichomitus squalens]|uniref:Uncharacterized protein n=1 Tax=Dichomitus squalens TaxID=114155 RepID=A0A4Q9NAA6_9APHY|nr:hypothetical protein BD309DRAFT_973314 [Dichomitus squalens]TBU60290.1 hypothetical protein BD310DRAFT_957759 [Dichomitus squalens]
MSTSEQKMDVDSQTTTSPPQDTNAGSAPESSGAAQAEPTTSRLERVKPRDLCEFKHSLQLVEVMLGAIVAHKRLYDDAGILHGDINPNTIVMLEGEDGKVKGALIDYDMPLCEAAMRKILKPDPAVPPPQQKRYRMGYWH